MAARIERNSWRRWPARLCLADCSKAPLRFRPASTHKVVISSKKGNSRSIARRRRELCSRNARRGQIAQAIPTTQPNETLLEKCSDVNMGGSIDIKTKAQIGRAHV